MDGLDVLRDVVEGARKDEKPDPLLDLFRLPLDGEREDWSSGSSLFATACTISVMDAGSFSGGECFQRSNGFSSSHGLSAPGMAIGGVAGFRDGDTQSLGFALSVIFRRLRAFASQFVI